ncbi:MAG: hypothetical protein IJL91_00065 [Bacteroidales bacterium]|nr:hypothetical protein [Bacteroidales bacterium]
MKRLAYSVFILLLSMLSLSAQEGNGIPEDVFYLMPSFGKGSIVYNGRPPVQGTFNICALDNSIRFKDRNGQELAADKDDAITKVVIDGVTFLWNQGSFYRLVPVTDKVGIAVKRDVLVMSDSKTGGYGMASQTTSIQEYGAFASGGQLYQLENVKSYPYRMSETVFLSVDNEVMPTSKKNFQKCFPDKKADIEAWFKSNKKAPDTKEGLLEFCRQWAGQ